MTALQTSYSIIPTTVPVPSAGLEFARTRVPSSCYEEVRNVSATFCDGALTLRGTFSSFYLEQIAQGITRDLQGIGDIENNHTYEQKRSAHR